MLDLINISNTELENILLFWWLYHFEQYVTLPSPRLFLYWYWMVLTKLICFDSPTCSLLSLSLCEIFCLSTYDVGLVGIAPPKKNDSFHWKVPKSLSKDNTVASIVTNGIPKKVVIKNNTASVVHHKVVVLNWNWHPVDRVYRPCRLYLCIKHPL